MSANPSWDCLVVRLERDCIEASLAVVGIVVLANFDRLQASVHLKIQVEVTCHLADIPFPCGSSSILVHQPDLVITLSLLFTKM